MFARLIVCLLALALTRAVLVADIDCATELADMAVLPGDVRFPDAVRINNPAYNMSQPAFVALPRDSFDVLRCMACAARTGVRVAIKSGGHSFAGYSTIAAPGFVVSTQLLNQVRWAASDVVTVGAGSTWIDVYSAFKQHGGLWVVTGGLCPSVGCVPWRQRCLQT